MAPLRVRDNYIYRLVGILFLLFFVFLLLLINNQYFPIVSVNGAWIMASELERDYRATMRLRSSDNNHPVSDVSTSTWTMSQSEIKATILTSLVEKRIISRAVKRELGKEANSIINFRVQEMITDPDMLRIGEYSYGLSTREMVSAIIEPEAKKQILEGRLYLQSVNFIDWLIREKERATVRVFSDKFIWDGENVIVRD